MLFQLYQKCKNSDFTCSDKHAGSEKALQVLAGGFDLAEGGFDRTSRPPPGYGHVFEWLQTVINDTYTVCVDLDTVPQNCRISEISYENVRPDLLLFNNSKIIILELTVCHESNLQKSKIYKQNKYADIKNFLQPKFRKHSVRLFTFEISVLGFISSLTNFCSILPIPELPKSFKSNLINSVLNSTYGIYCKRNMN